MDLVGYDESVFNEIRDEVQTLAGLLDIKNIDYIPISALKGDNVLQRPGCISWYNAQSLLHRLDDYEINKSDHHLPLRVCIQNTILTDERQLCFGKVLSGTVHETDVLCHYVTGNRVMIDTLVINNESKKSAKPGDNICFALDKNIIVERGDVLGYPDEQPYVRDEFEVDICWLEAETGLTKASEYLLRLGAREVKCVVLDVLYKRTFTDLEHRATVANVSVNEFARIILKTDCPVVFDSYHNLPQNGRGILIDKETNNTVAAVVVA